MKTTNCKQVIEKVQAYLLDWAADRAAEYGLSDGTTPQQAFHSIVSQYMRDYGQYGRDAASWATPAGVLRHFVEGAMMDVYYSQVDERLESWGLDPQKYDNDTNWNTYIRLVCRDGQRLFNKINKQ